MGYRPTSLNHFQFPLLMFHTSQHYSLSPPWSSLFLSIIFYTFIFFIYLFLAALGIRCCVQAFSSCGKRGLFFIVVCGPLIAVASLVAEHGL